jgi:diadenosine tetraphosphate (Ap4A) HIT family hydrolase
MDCQFCTEFTTGTSRIITEVEGWVLLPTVGCFTPGYCLLMPFRHLDAAADAPAVELASVQDAVEDIRDVIASAFGPTIVAEHGPRGCELGASCCSHAHLHFIPVPDPSAVTSAYRSTGGSGLSIAGLTELAHQKDDPYLYLSPRAAEHLVWPSDGFARQYVRRVCASMHGLGPYFDWRDYPFLDNQRYTFDVIHSKLRSRAA